MLKEFINYENEVKLLYNEHTNNERCRYLFSNGFWSALEIETKHNFCNITNVSVNPNTNKVIGLLTCEFSRTKKVSWGLYFVNFYEDLLSKYIFSKDLKEYIFRLFFVYNCNYVGFVCSDKHPKLEKYRKLCKKYGGREVGYFTDDFIDLYGEISNKICFEIGKPNLLNILKRRIK